MLIRLDPVPEWGDFMYRLMLVLSLVSGLWYASKELKEKGVPANIRRYLILLVTSSVVYLGLAVTLVLTGGKTFGLNGTGGAMGLIIGTFIFTRITPQYSKALVDSYFLVLPLMYGVAKIGCVFAGCCYGIEYSGIGHIHTSHGDVFPIQAVEAVIFIMIFAASVYLQKKKMYDPIIAAIIYSNVKLLLDFLRFTHVNNLITSNQIMCAVIAAGLIAVKLYMNNKKVKIA